MKKYDKSLNSDITSCLQQLAERAEEIGERNTAIVLLALCSHRLVTADLAMALTAQDQFSLLQLILKGGGYETFIIDKLPPVDWFKAIVNPTTDPTKPKDENPT
jgi:hypothetical protein